LRSLDNLSFEHEVFLIGDKPSWTTGINHIPSTRIKGMDFMSFLDTHHKMNLAANHKDVTEEFIVMYDDTYIIAQTSIHDIKQPRAMLNLIDNPPWQASAITNGASRKWVSLVDKVINVMRKQGNFCYNWETHLPRIISKENTKLLFDKYNLSQDPYNFFSLYMNEFMTQKPELIHPDGAGYKMGVYSPSSLADIISLKKENKILNHSCNAYNQSMRDFLDYLFPNKSKYEK
jgi:hypothetical protein